MVDRSDPGQNSDETGPESAKTRAIEAARAGATDAEVAAVLRVDCGLAKRDSERRVKRWARVLEDARTAGRLAPLEALHAATKAGDATAAAHLARREQRTPDGEIKRLLAELGSMTPQQQQRLLEQLGAQLERVPG